jgi:predicted nucleotidyltransferase
MNQQLAIAKLKANEDAIRALGATALFLYGSTARNEAGPQSDIDVFVEYAPVKFTLFELAGLKALLEEKLGVSVDVTTRKGLNPRLRKRIEESAIRVF